MIERASLGIKELDEALEGGIPKGRWAIVTGEPGVGKSVLCLHFAYAGLKAGDPVVYVTSEHEFRDVILQAKQLGMDFGPVHALAREEKQTPEGQPQMVVVDLYSLLNISSKISEGKEGQYHNTLSISALVKAINEAFKVLDVMGKSEVRRIAVPNKHVRLIIDSISSFWIDEPLIRGFNHDLKVTLRRGRVTMLTTMYTDNTLYAGVEHIADGLIHMWMDDVRTEGMIKRYLIIKKMKLTNHSRNALQFEIVPGKGITILGKQ